MTAKSGDHLRRLVRGTTIVFLGNVVGMGANFLIRLVAGRHLGPSSYGLVVLGVTILNLAAIISLLGLHIGLAQRLPGVDNGRQLFYSTTFVAIPIGTLLGGFLVIFHDTIASVFNDPLFGEVLPAFAIGVPFVVFIRLAIGSFRATERSAYKVIVNDFFYKGLTFALVFIGSLLGFSVVGIAWAWVLAIVVAALVGVYLTFRNMGFPSRESVSGIVELSETRSLVMFSLPLMVSGTLGGVMRQTDNLLLGFFLQSGNVGTYDAAFTLANAIFVFTSPFGFLFLPLFSELYRDKQLDEMSVFYQFVTKWMAFLVLPVYMMILLYPDFLLGASFGADFDAGGLAMILVATGFFIQVLTGRNGEGVIAIGKSRVLMYGNLIAFISNVILNIILIPQFGIVGAGFAVMFAHVAANIYYGYYLHSRVGIHPVSLSLFRPLVFSSAAFLLVGSGVKAVADTNLVVVSGVFGTLLIVHLVLIVTLGGIETRELELLSDVDDRFPFNTELIEDCLLRWSLVKD